MTNITVTVDCWLAEVNVLTVIECGWRPRCWWWLEGWDGSEICSAPRSTFSWKAAFSADNDNIQEMRMALHGQHPFRIMFSSSMFATNVVGYISGWTIRRKRWNVKYAMPTNMCHQPFLSCPKKLFRFWVFQSSSVFVTKPFIISKNGIYKYDQSWIRSLLLLFDCSLQSGHLEEMKLMINQMIGCSILKTTSNVAWYYQWLHNNSVQW